MRRPLAAPLGAQPPAEARLTVDVSRREGAVSPLLYGQFLEFMYEGIKGGLHAELLRGRRFEEAPNAIGLPRPWERYPDDRDDDHALRVVAGDGVIARHGLYQPRVPLRAGVSYSALWLRSADYAGPVVVALEQDASGGRVYAESRVDVAPGDWRRVAATLRLAP